MCCTLESALTSKELFFEQAFPQKYMVSLDSDKFSRTLSAIVVKGSSEHKKVHVNEHEPKCTES